MALSDSLVSTVLRLLEKYGEPLVLSRSVEGTYSTDTLTTSPSTDSTYVAYGVPDVYKDIEMTGTLIQRGDSILYIRTSVVPAIGDEVTYNGQIYRLINVEHYRVQGKTVLYKLQVRI